MTIEALWTVRFGAIGANDAELNGGVAMIESGKIFGGDSLFAYIGEITLKAGEVAGTLRILQHEPSGVSMYGRQETDFSLSFEGNRIGADRVEGRLIRKDFPDARLLLRRLANLP